MGCPGSLIQLAESQGLLGDATVYPEEEERRRGDKERRGTAEKERETKKEEVRRCRCQRGGVKRRKEVGQEGWEEEGEEVI